MSNLLVEIMNDYLIDDELSPGYINGRVDRTSMDREAKKRNLPVQPKSNDWSVITEPRRLVRQYTFDSHDVMSAYINELLAYETASQHYAKLTISFPTVDVEVYTHDVSDVTELDQEYAQTADEIYNDVLDITFTPSSDEDFNDVYTEFV